ncbi:1,2-phenylacetyl-CoA epoxidase subunit PaaD [Govanella unica]|uniref:Phenylacetate-CoA oxygenase subunit PaaJ n=1 Tax=Govanella unica TaxID=2975056 RepID=A0A9X3TZI5_9PROT|nr:1,2-phenylacetyl-CoA epoxidase subunit PaaD [Govania unica]MDA5194468.1 phenylacetate-CoA oxygenase subunit PaaJ [Govania unica]
MSDIISLAKTREEKAIWAVLDAVPDPEVPVLSVVDLGIVRGVEIAGDNVTVSVTPTYSGCPATLVIEVDILTALKRNGYPNAKVKTVLSPAWTTDWLSERGREKLREYGIAPPVKSATHTGSDDRLARKAHVLLGEDPDVPCPLCGSHDTRKVSNFGSTPCKAHYACNACLEPFDYFKCL